MGRQNLLWNYSKKAFTCGLIGVTISDSYASGAVISCASMSPTFNPNTRSLMDDYVLVDKYCLRDHKFSHGDVVLFSSPTNHKERHIKTIFGLLGDWIGIRHCSGVLRIPGHCWVEGDNPASSMDSNSFGPGFFWEVAFGKPYIQLILSTELIAFMFWFSCGKDDPHTVRGLLRELGLLKEKLLKIIFLISRIFSKSYSTGTQFCHIA